ncbi:hypothetical protein QCA50_013200 [Cerrena zonata]|uniref:Yeast cell wall synthesis Kre9/Knh1-like N-terminal domain-containing protein n=1 Tax=Cerrena zonata TaxID=2478898 RepID=A0AAW0FXJ9_9APHY
MFASALLALAALASSAQAAIFVTAPVASTSWAAGQQQTISWQDDGTTPNLASFGPAKVTLGVGNAITQTQVQTVVDSVDVSTTSSIVFTPDATVGANGAVYFIRFESLALKDATSPQFPALGFSAKFTLSGMSGTFNSTVQSQIDGSSTAPLGATSSGASSATSSASATSKASTGSTSATSTRASTSASATGAANNGAFAVAASPYVAAAGSIMALAAAMVL